MNPRMKRLKDRQAALVKQANALLEAASNEDRELTAEQDATYKVTTTELDGIKASIKREEDLAQYHAEATPLELDGPTTHVIGTVKPAFEKDPKRGFESPRDFLMSVLKFSGQPSKQVSDDRLRFLATAGSDEQGGYSDPYGGFLVPTAFSPDFLSLRPEDDPIGGRTTKVPMTSPKVEIPARVDKDHTTSVSGGLTVSRRAETQAQSAARMQMEKVVLSAYSLFGLAYASEEILTDSPISFAAILEQGFRDQFTYHLINERLNGTGVGEMEGIMNAPALVTVNKDANQTNTTVTATNILNMRARCWKYSNAIWLANHDVLPGLTGIALVIGTNQWPVALYQQSMREDTPDMLMGRPIFYTEYCKTLGTAGDIVLANWAEYLEGTYQPLQSAESIHVRFVNHERTFKFWLRNGGKSWWRSALTPKNSTSTLSPFVTLAGRP